LYKNTGGLLFVKGNSEVNNTMKNLFVIVIIVSSFLRAGDSIAQKQTALPFHYRLETGGFTSMRGEVPFWQRSNNFGAYPNKGTSLYFRQMVYSKPDSSNRKFKIHYGADLITIVGKESSLRLPEAFLKLKLGIFEFTGGRIKGMQGLADTTLSSGSITWSGNAMPIPEVRIAIPEYTRLFVDWLALKGHYTHGWFGTQQSVKNYFLHQKSLYGRVGKPDGKLRFYAGILHHVQWGGIPLYPIEHNPGLFKNGRFPTDLFTYTQVVFPFSSKSGDFDYSEFDLTNRFGNHLGQIDLGGDINLGSINLLVYKQTIFESGQTFSSLTNTDDGLYGISLKSRKANPILRKLVLEYLRTTNQSRYRSGLARLLGLPDRHYGEENYYFNHMQYLDGWAYNRYTIGTPFLVPQGQIRAMNQTYPNAIFYNNNRIIAGYAGVELLLNNIIVQARASYSRNYGALFTPMPPVNQLSMNIQTLIPTKNKNAFVKVNIGIDQGNLINDNYGTHIGYQRFW
jgi:hypothetical protein